MDPDVPSAAVAPQAYGRALAIGAGLGAVLAAGNVFLGLKTGWWDAGSLLACSSGFALLRAVRATPTPADTVLVQSVATSAAAMPSVAGLLGAWPALALLHAEPSTLALVLWGASLAALGIALALALVGRQVDPLPWPSPRAASEVVRALHAGRDAGSGRLLALGVSSTFAAIVVVLRDGLGWLPQLLGPSGMFRGVPAPALLLGVTPSPALLAAGLLVGARLGLSVLAGGVLAWGILAPGLVTSGLARSSEYASIVAWLLWPAIALALGAGVAPLGQLLWGLRRRARWRRTDALLLAPPALATALAGVLALGLPVWPVCLGLLLFVVLGPVVSRLAGETDVAPFGQAGQAAQTAAAALAPLDAAGNVLVGSVAAGASAQTVYTLSTLKLARLLGLAARPQLLGQIVGAAVGLVVLVPVYRLLVGRFVLGSPELPAPAALAWKGLAEVAATGAAAFPRGAAPAAAIALGAGIVLGLLEGRRGARWVPSAYAVSVGMLVPAGGGAAIALGALAGLALEARWRGAARLVSAVAAGGIAGEAIAGVVVAAVLSAR